MKPFFFEQLPRSEKFFVSNLLGEWRIADNKRQLLDAIDGTESIFTSDNLSVDNFQRAAVARLTKKFLKTQAKPDLVMVVPTLRCDHSCLYCQVSRASIHSNCHDLDLAPEQVADWFLSVASSQAKLEFQGGEPLLRQDYLRATIEALDARTEWHYEIVIATALGPELSESFLEWCRDRHVRFSVSFDGDPSEHSSVRKSRLFDSFMRFQSQNDRLRNGINPAYISYVSTLTDRTVQKDPGDYMASCRKMGVSRIFSRPVMPYGFAIETSNSLGIDEDRWWVFIEEYLDETIESYHRGNTFIDDLFTLYLRNLVANDTSGYVDLMSPAGYALSCCILNYDGFVYGSDEARMLYEATKDESLRIANPGDGKSAKNLESHVSMLSDSFLEVMPHCDLCAFQPYCGADPVHHIHSQNDAIGFKYDSHVCRSTKNILSMLAQRIEDGRLAPELMRLWLS